MSMFHRVAEYLSPVLKDSKFRETGVLTPSEFVAAGEHLVFQCPTWSWGSGEKSKIKSYLPADKQFLVTRKLSCYKRYKDIESLKFEERLINEDDDEGGWVDTYCLNDTKDNEETNISKDDSFSAIHDDHKQAAVVKQANDESDDSEAEDIENFVSSGLDDEQDECVVDPSQLSDAMNELDVGDNNVIVKTRTYDLYITYDKYYQTPRLWLVGYDEHNNPLNIEQMYEDISQDHAKKTVTMEWHPHIPTTMASIHPCRHAEMMKKILKTMEENGKRLEVHNYLIIFLKFVQSVIPTIQYDYTQNFSM